MFVFLTLISFSSTVFALPNLNPVLLVPGDGGTRIQGKYRVPSAPHYVCKTHLDTFKDIWFSPSLLAPYKIDCFVDLIRLKYNKTSRNTYNMPGVETRIQDFGGVSSIDWLYRYHISNKAIYFDTMIKELELIGYKIGVSLRGVPYDFRKAANEMTNLFENLTELIETTYKMNGNRRVIFIGHSLGNLVLLYYLNHQSQEWKDKYIELFITLAAPWGGAVRSLRMVTSGYNINLVGVHGLSLRPLQRSMPSTYWLLPQKGFWDCTEYIVITSARAYSICNLKELLNDLGVENGVSMYQNTHNLTTELIHPGVPVHCMYGTDVETAGMMILTTEDEPDILFDTGDGSVNIRSLEGCLRWKNISKYKLNVSKFPTVDHKDILINKRVIKAIMDTLIQYSVENSINKSHTAVIQTSMIPTTSTSNVTNLQLYLYVVHFTLMSLLINLLRH